MFFRIYPNFKNISVIFLEFAFAYFIVFPSVFCDVSKKNGDKNGDKSGDAVARFARPLRIKLARA